MYIIPTLKEFIDNPMGKGSTAIPSRQLIRDDLARRLRGLLSHDEKEITFKIYRTADNYLFHFLIPSESERKNTYDVVLEFFVDEDNKTAASDQNLNRYKVRFFSNSPGFAFTYAYAFNLMGYLVPSLSKKFSSSTLEHPPITRNPGEIISYEKTIFFACIHLLQHNHRYLNKTIINPLTKPYNAVSFARNIRTMEQIMFEIEKEKRRLAREKEEREKQEARSGRKLRGGRESTKLQKKEKTTNIGKVTSPQKITARHATKSKIRPR